MTFCRDLVVSIDYAELKAATHIDLPTGQKTPEEIALLLEKIGKAFGNNDECLGILAVTGVPNITSLRGSLLPLARDLAALPPSDLQEVVVPSAAYQVGWSHGREKLQGDRYDFSKGSFYANPLTDDFLSAAIERSKRNTASENDDDNDTTSTTAEELRDAATNNVPFFAPNVWPSKIPELERDFKELGNLVVNVGIMIARLCDLYVQSKCPNASFTRLEHVITNSLFCKARLLHYFPSDAKNNDKNEDDFSDWCGWHNDHGSLTGLVPGMFLDVDSGAPVLCPDPDAGLYIKSRGGKTVQVQLPTPLEDCLAFQIGETTQIHSGGVLSATPHAVRGCKENSMVSRESFAVFMEPEYHGRMNFPTGRTVEDAQNEKAASYLPKGIKTLKSRWKSGMNFGEFSHATFEAFH